MPGADQTLRRETGAYRRTPRGMTWEYFAARELFRWVQQAEDVLERQPDDDGGAAGGRTVDRDLAVVRFDQTFGRRQAQAGPARFGREERREDLLADLRWHAWSAIDERNPTRRSTASTATRIRALALHGVGAVDQQILKHDPEHVRIRRYRRRRSFDLDFHVSNAGSRLNRLAVVVTSGTRSVGARLGCGGRANSSRSFIIWSSESIRDDDFLHDLLLRVVPATFDCRTPASRRGCRQAGSSPRGR